MTSKKISEQPKTYELMVVKWEGRLHCVYLDNTRIAGGKPWGGGDIAATWQVSLKDIAHAVPEVLDAVEALRFGLELYGLDAPDGRWPMEKRQEFDRRARSALGLNPLTKDTPQ